MSRQYNFLSSTIIILILIASLLISGCSKSPTNVEPEKSEAESQKYSQKEEYKILEEQKIIDHDVLSEDNPTPGTDEINFKDAIVYAIKYYEQENNVKLNNVDAYANYRGNKDSENVSYLIEFKDSEGESLSKIRIDAITGELMSME